VFFSLSNTEAGGPGILHAVYSQMENIRAAQYVLFLISRKIIVLDKHKGQKSVITGMKDVSEFTCLLWGKCQRDQ